MTTASTDRYDAYGIWSKDSKHFKLASMFQLKGIQGQEITAIFPTSFITLNPTASRCGGFQNILTIFPRIKRVCWVDEECRYRTKLRYMITSSTEKYDASVYLV